MPKRIRGFLKPELSQGSFLSKSGNMKRDLTLHGYGAFWQLWKLCQGMGACDSFRAAQIEQAEDLLTIKENIFFCIENFCINWEELEGLEFSQRRQKAESEEDVLLLLLYYIFITRLVPCNQQYLLVKIGIKGENIWQDSLLKVRYIIVLE